MGNKKRRLEQFLTKHSICCFCGGDRVAETEDHIPSRSIFENRVWPKGYVFPACVSCNQSTVDEEAIIAMLSRFDSTSKGAADESAKLIKAFAERHPELAREMPMTANEARRALRKLGLEKPEELGFGELPLVKLPREIDSIVRRFGTKLIKALHYMHTGRIVTNDAGILIYWHTNAQHIAGKFPEQVAHIFNGVALPTRDSTPLHDQFSYRYAISDDGLLGGYVAFFRRAFSITGMLSFDASLLDSNDLDEDSEN